MQGVRTFELQRRFPVEVDQQDAVFLGQGGVAVGLECILGDAAAAALADGDLGVAVCPAVPVDGLGGRWGTFNLGGTVSMAGSLKDMVIFE